MKPSSLLQPVLAFCPHKRICLEKITNKNNGALLRHLRQKTLEIQNEFTNIGAIIESLLMFQLASCCLCCLCTLWLQGADTDAALLCCCCFLFCVLFFNLVSLQSCTPWAAVKLHPSPQQAALMWGTGRNWLAVTPEQLHREMNSGLLISVPLSSHHFSLLIHLVGLRSLEGPSRPVLGPNLAYSFCGVCVL